MAQVTVTIAGKAYRMGCDDGQEGHLADLAAELDRRIGAMRKSFGEIGEMRLTIMAAVALTDELHEQKQRISKAEAEISALKSGIAAVEDKYSAELAGLAKAIGAVAGRIDATAELIGGRVDAGAEE